MPATDNIFQGQRLFDRTAAILFLAAFAVRALHIFFISQNSPFIDVLPGDLGAYHSWAKSIVSQGWIGKDIFYQDPLYPYFLAMVYTLIGEKFVLIYLLQALLGAVTAAMIYLAGKQMFSKNTGLVSGTLFAFYAPAIFFDGLLLKVSLSAFLCMACFCLLIIFRGSKQQWRSLIGAGICFGLAVLTRANFLLLAPVIVAVLVFSDFRKIRKGVVSAVFFTAGTVMILFPVVLRNYYVSGSLVVTTAQAGQNFFIGQNPRATGTYIGLPFVRPDPLYERLDFQNEAQRRLGKTLSPPEVSQYWFAQGMAFIRENPTAFLRLTWTKFRLFFNNYEMPDNHNFYFHKKYSHVLNLLPVSFYLVGPFFFVGMVALFRERRFETNLLFYSQLAYIVSVLGFYVFSRYRMPVIPLFCLTAGYGTLSLLSNIKENKALSAGIKLGAAAIILVWVSIPVFEPFNFGHSYVDEAIAYELKNNPEKAVESYRQALEINPEYLRALERLGRLQLRLGAYAEAQKTYKKILEVRADSPEAKNVLFLISRKSGQ
ncbi:MAG: glycosyltransferase family 39 protein [Proteobacteria bacterium]|nr:glycosyltransferase family 39 protein [Pseudomonadota bacterium]